MGVGRSSFRRVSDRKRGVALWRGGAGRMAENFGRMDGHVALRYSGEQKIACELYYF